MDSWLSGYIKADRWKMGRIASMQACCLRLYLVVVTKAPYKISPGEAWQIQLVDGRLSLEV